VLAKELMPGVALEYVRSQAVAVRSGFTREGIEREAERIGERRLDLVRFSRLRTD
jgi:RimJ/RimL family protein N-acetyltransferase